MHVVRFAVGGGAAGHEQAGFPLDVPGSFTTAI